MKKVLILGDAGVGKTCLVERLCNEPLVYEYHATKNYVVHEYGNYYIWDTPGKKDAPLGRKVLENVSICVILFSMIDRESLRNTPYWLEQVLEYSPNCKVILAGNKCDGNPITATEWLVPNHIVSKIKGYVRMSIPANIGITRLVSKFD